MSDPANIGLTSLRGGLARAIVDYFVAEPLACVRVERVASDVGASVTETSQALTELAEIGLLRRERGASGDAYFLRPADTFLAILEGLSSFYSDHIDSVAIVPERAQLATGESTEDLASLRSLRARVASLEATNALLQRKNLELSFLYETSVLLASSIDPTTLAHSTLDAVAGASHLRALRYFVALVEGDALAFVCGIGVDAEEATRIMRRELELLRRCTDRGEVVAIPAHASAAGEGARAFVALPMSALPGEPAHGCIVITETVSDGLTTEDLRLLTMLAERAGRGFANAALFAQSVTLGVTDELTGAFNRRYLFRRLAEEMKRARRLTESLALLICDLDLFKSVNDRYGHAEGDLVLRAVAKTVIATVRGIDVVTRFGGEEFAVILPGAKDRDAFIIAERVRRAVERLSHATTTGDQLALTISCGVASLEEKIHTPSQLMAAADRCLLEAKRAGRNRTVMSAQ